MGIEVARFAASPGRRMAMQVGRKGNRQNLSLKLFFGFHVSMWRGSNIGYPPTKMCLAKKNRICGFRHPKFGTSPILFGVAAGWGSAGYGRADRIIQRGVLLGLIRYCKCGTDHSSKARTVEMRIDPVRSRCGYMMCAYESITKLRFM